MKTKTEYLKDLELTTLEDKKELKKHYRKLVKIYNLDNGTSKNELRIKEVHSAYEALLNDKYKPNEPLGESQEKFDPKIEAERSICLGRQTVTGHTASCGGSNRFLNGECALKVLCGLSNR